MPKFSYELQSETGAEPVTLAEAKAHLNVTGSDDDTYITTLITVARKVAEKMTCRVLVRGTWKVRLDEFPDKNREDKQIFLFDKWPVASVESIKYQDDDNVQQTLSTTLYRVDIYTKPARIELIDLPSTYDEVFAVEIAFTAGYATAADVPEPIKQAVLMMIENMYSCRGDRVRNLPTASEYILNNYSVCRF